MTSLRLARAGLAPRRLTAALVLTLCSVVPLAAASPASAVTHKRAAKTALAALGSANGSDPVVVFGLPRPVAAGTRVTQSGSKSSLVKVGSGGAFLFYEDAAPSQAYPHAGRVALVSVSSGKVKVSKTIKRQPLVNGRLAAFLRSPKAYGSSKYRIFARTASSAPAGGDGLFADDPFGPGKQPLAGLFSADARPKANPQSLTVKQNKSRSVTLTGSDDDGDLLTFVITDPPDYGTLSGQPPELVYTPNTNYLGKDKFAFKSFDGAHYSNTAHVTLDVVPVGSPPVVTTSAGCTAYTEQAPAVAVDDQLLVSDPDDENLDSARVWISANLQDGDELLFTDQNGITGSFEDETGVLTLTGASTVANYRTALRSVRYRNLANVNPTATKDVTFTANDAGSDSAPATKQICITGGAGGADRPSVEPSEGGLSYTENDGPVPVDGGIVVGDPDSATLSGATIKFVPVVSQPVDENGDPVGPPVSTVTFAPDEDGLAFTDQSGITGSYDDVTGVLSLSGTASVAAYEAAIRSVTYENSSEDPSDAPRRIRFQVTDSSSQASTPKTRDIFVTPVNDAPVVTTSEGSTSATGDDPSVVVDEGVTPSDVDDDDLEGAQVRIASGFEEGDELLYVDQLGITGVYDTGTGVLTLSGTAPVADYQTALRSVRFTHPGGNPAGSRTVEFTVNDGDLDSEAASKGIEANDKPVLVASDGAASFTEGDGATTIDPELTATDGDTANLTGATVQISSNYNPAEDSLAFANQNGITGTYDTDTGTLTLTGSAPVADYEAALRNVVYQNSSEDPSADTRTVTFQADDGQPIDNLSDSVTRDVTVTPVNDAPVVTTSDGTTSYTQGGPSALVDSELTVVDVDDDELVSAQVRIADFEAGDVLAFDDTEAITGSYDSDTGVLDLTGTASVADYESALRAVAFSLTGENPSSSRAVEFTVNDGDVGSNVASKSIAISGPNEAPVVTTSDGSTQVTLDDAGGAEVDSALTVTDADDVNLESAHVQVEGFEAGDDLVFTPQLGISGSFDSEVGVLDLAGTATVADYQTALRSIKFRHFGDNQSSSRSIAFKVNDGTTDSSFALKSIDLVSPPPEI